LYSAASLDFSFDVFVQQSKFLLFSFELFYLAYRIISANITEGLIARIFKPEEKSVFSGPS
jgi:hypothetical protein